MKYLFVWWSIGIFLSTSACNTQEEPVVEVPEPPKSDTPEAPIAQKPRIIFDTDIAADCDDVGAMAVLHALADNGELEIAGMMVSMPVAYGAPALDAINTFYNRPDIPIGTLRNSSDGANSGGLTVYNKTLAESFPNDLKHADNAPNALTLYRELLVKERDSSVIILTVGPLTNLYHLMTSKPDSISTLNGIDLIKKKVKFLVTAGGSLPEGSSYNFRMAPEKAEYVINSWPTQYLFVPNELGDEVLTGNRLIAETTPGNPVRKAYQLYKAAHPDFPFRPSWDQMGVIIAARGKAGLFKTDTGGSVVADRHRIKWLEDPDKNHVWYQNDSSPDERKEVIEDLMIQRAKKR